MCVFVCERWYVLKNEEINTATLYTAIAQAHNTHTEWKRANEIRADQFTGTQIYTRSRYTQWQRAGERKRQRYGTEQAH